VFSPSLQLERKTQIPTCLSPIVQPQDNPQKSPQPENAFMASSYTAFPFCL